MKIHWIDEANIQRIYAITLDGYPPPKHDEVEFTVAPKTPTEFSKITTWIVTSVQHKVLRYADGNIEHYAVVTIKRK